MIGRYTCDPKGSYANRIAYDYTTQRFYIEFKQAGTVWVYEAVPNVHFTNVRQCIEMGERLTSGDITTYPFESKPGSEGSYLKIYIVGRDTKNPPFKCHQLDAVDAAEIFPHRDPSEDDGVDGYAEWKSLPENGQSGNRL